MTRRERLESKLQKRIDWAASRASKAESEYNRADLREEKSGIPLGQPILVGHHSEGRHRRAIAKAQNAMRRASEHNAMARHHEVKAAGLEYQLSNTIFSDDEDAVEALEAKIAKLEAERELNNKTNAIIRMKPKNLKTDEKIAALIPLGYPAAVAEKLFEPDFCGRIGIAAYVNQNLGGRIKAARDRLAVIKLQKANQEAAAQSEAGVVIKTNTYGRYFVTFAEKPEREILTALKEAGYRWCKGSWVGEKDRLPECVKELANLEAVSCPN